MRLVLLALAAIKFVLVNRALGPREIGLFALVAVILGIGESITETGINIILIRTKAAINEFVNTAWVVSIIRALLIAVLVIIGGVGLVYFYNEPSIYWLAGLSALVPIVRGFINPAVIGWQKELKFAADSWYRGSVGAIDAMAAIAISTFIPTAAALILAMLVAASYEVIISFTFARPLPKWQFKKKIWQEIWQQSSWLNAQALCSYLSENLDNLLIGKLMGTTSLGYYASAYNASHKVTYDIGKSINHSTVPIYSKIRHEKARLKQAIKRTFIIGTALVFVIALPLLLMPWLPASLMGSAWQPITPLLRWFILAGFMQHILLLTWSPLTALGKFAPIVYGQIWQILVMIGLIFLLVPTYGLIGAALAMIISRLVSLPITLWQMKNI